MRILLLHTWVWWHGSVLTCVLHSCLGIMNKMMRDNVPADVLYCIWSFLSVRDLKFLQRTMPCISSSISDFLSIIKGQLYRKEWVVGTYKWWKDNTVLFPITVRFVEEHVSFLHIEYQETLSGNISSIFFKDNRDMLRFDGHGCYPKQLGLNLFRIGAGKPKKPVITQYRIGEQFDCPDAEGVWYIVTIVNQTGATVTIRFEGWTSKWDQVVPKNKNNLCPLHSYTIPWRQRIHVHDTLEYFKNNQWCPVIVNRIVRETIYFRFVRAGDDVESDSRYSDRFCPLGVHVRPYLYKRQFCSLNQTRSPYVFEVEREGNYWRVTM